MTIRTQTEDAIKEWQELFGFSLKTHQDLLLTNSFLILLSLILFAKLEIKMQLLRFLDQLIFLLKMKKLWPKLFMRLDLFLIVSTLLLKNLSFMRVEFIKARLVTMKEV